MAIAILSFASACLDDQPAAPGSLPVTIAMQAQVDGGRTVAIDVYYRISEGGEAALIALPSQPTRVTVQPGTVQVPVTVDVAACLEDDRRVRSARDDTCPMVIILRLLGENDEEIDSEQIEPEAPAAGETVTLPTVTLRQPQLVLAPAALTFSVVERSVLPDAQVVAISNGGGGSLGDLSVEVVEEASEWLQAALSEDGTSVSVRPTTSSLEPGTHAATVLVHATGVPNSPQAIEVTYEVASIPLHLLTVNAGGNGSGRLTSDPAGIDCTINAGVATGACSASFEEGDLVFLVPEPQSGSRHAGWSGECEGTGGCGVIVLGPRQVTATFLLLERLVTVTASGTGDGRITSSPEGLDCSVRDGSVGEGCSAPFDHGTVVTLAFQADEGNAFGGWGGACAGADTCTVTLTEPRDVSVLVHRLASVSVRAGSGSGTGVVRSAPASIECAVSPEGREGTCVALVALGTEVTLSAIPDAPNTFGGWQGACDTSQSTCIITIDGAIDVGAIFVRPPNTLTVTPAGNGSGTIVSEPAGIACTWASGAATGACAAQFAFGTEVTLRATSGVGSDVAGWSGACSGTAPCVVLMTEARNVSASFALVQHQLSVSGSGPGSGTINTSPQGIACSIGVSGPDGDCVEAFDHGTVVTLVPSPAPNSVFAGWTGACSTTADTCTVTMTEARSVGASFALVPVRLDVTGAGEGAGLVTSDPAGIRCTIREGVQTGECGASFPYGTQVRLLPAPEQGSTFGGWSGACVGTSECLVVMTAAQRVTASFGLARHRLTVQGAGNAPGAVRSDPSGIACTYSGESAGGDCVEDFAVGTRVTLTPDVEAESYAVFTGWSGACTGTGPCIIDVTQDRIVTARFDYAIPVSFDISGTGSGRITSQPAVIDCRVTAGVPSGTCAAAFPLGTELTVLATPDAGSDGGFPTEGGFTRSQSVTLLEPQAEEFAVQFVPERHLLTVTTQGAGRGIVRSDPEGIVCWHNLDATSDCVESYDHGTPVTLEASRESGYTFAGWSGACSGTGPCMVDMTEARSVTATFEVSRYTLTVKGGGNGNGRISAYVNDESVIDCTIHLGVAASGTCVAELLAGTVISLEADYYYYENEFLGWSGSCSGTDQCTLSMTGNMEVTASFDLEAALSVEVQGDVEAYVTSEPGRIECTIAGEGGSGTCHDTLPGGTVVTLRANTPEHAIFHGWGGDCEDFDEQPTCTLTMDGRKLVTAAFESTLRFLSVNVVGTGSVTSEPGGIVCKRLPTGALDPSGFCVDVFPVGSNVVLTATADPTTSFTGWSGACSGKEPTCTVNMLENLVATATFQPRILDSLIVRGLGTGNGWVRSQPGGIDCRISGGSISGTAGCETVFERGTAVRLTASPDEDSEFVQWQAGTACAGSKDPVCDVTMAGITRVTVGIGTKPPPQYTLTIQGAGSGHGSVFGPSFACATAAGVTSGTCTATFDERSVVMLTASAQAGSEFTGWTGACSGTSPTNCSVDMTEHRTVTAGFSKSWTAMASGTIQTLNAVDGTSSTNVFAVGTLGTILHFDGVRWSPMTSGTTATLNAVFVLGGATYAVGSGGTILRWNGESWSRMESGTTATLYDIWGTIADGLFVIGENGLILRSDGAGWRAIGSGVSATLRGIYGSSASWITAVGLGGSLTEFNFFGWQSDPGPSAEDLYDVWQPASFVIWAVGAGGTLAFSDGFKWSIVTPTTTRFNSIRGSSLSYLVAVGDGGTIYRYDGTAWTPMRSGTTRQLNGVWAPRTSATADFFAVGAFGTILRHTVP